MATSAAVSTFRRVYSDPEGEAARQAFQARTEQYRYYWEWYVGSVYQDLLRWSVYKRDYRLYRAIRGIYNPAGRLVDIYVGSVYPGFLSEDAERLPDGVRLAIPLAEDTPTNLRSAIGQFWQWSNWQAGKSLMVLYGAALGDVLVEVSDEVDRGKITANIVWPGQVVDLDLDATGNVKGYALEYQAEDGNGKSYTYRKEVDQSVIRTKRDGEIYDYDGSGGEYGNPYGFVPAVWVKHRDLGGDHGSPAYRNIVKWDELNGLLSHMVDQDHKVLGAPLLISASGGVSRLFDKAKDGASADMTNPETNQENLNILKGPEGASVTTIQPEVGETLSHVQEIIQEIEDDHPELTMYKQLRAMSAVTGPGAARMMGDAVGNITNAQAAYDVQSIKLFQMAVAIGGWRANSGAWGSGLSLQQEKFRPFGLDSYARGDLDFAIEPRPVVPLTPLEQIELERQRFMLEQDKMGMQSQGSVEQRLRDAAAQNAAQQNGAQNAQPNQAPALPANQVVANEPAA